MGLMDNKLISFLLKHNQTQSALFISPDADLARREYRSAHPTEIAALKCMDGRLNLSVATETPAGIIQPFRNIGGIFDVGWPYFGQVLHNWIEYAVSRNRKCLILVTYHFSKGDAHRGCAGHSYDTAAAKASACALKRQIEVVFGTQHAVVYPVVVGFETDEDAILLHGTCDDEPFNLADEIHIDEEGLRHRVEDLYPDMPDRIVTDLLPLLRGNLQHVEKIRRDERPLEEARHKEQVLAVGRGFDWLHLPNKALIVGPYSYNLDEPIVTAGKLLLGNLKDGRIPMEDGIALLSSAVYRDQIGAEPPRALEKAKSLAKFAQETLNERVPELTRHLHVLVGTVNQHTRLFTPVKNGE